LSAANDRNLLLGVLALQMEFVSRDQLIDALHAWVLDKSRPLDDILLDQGALQRDTQALLTALVDKHVEIHGGSPANSLASLSSLGGAELTMAEIDDPDVHASLGHRTVQASSAPESATRSAGSSTSAGERFRILRPHAEGGLGKVFVALDGELGREVALKEIHGGLADEAAVRTRFVMEAEITGGLEHPGIVPVYGLGHYGDGRPFYAMRFVRGDSLKEAADRYHAACAAGLSAREKTLQFRQLLGRFIDVCNAIDYAHSRGVLHRDLKPGNIMLGKYGETLVVDWGLAKLIEGQEDPAPDGEGKLRTRSGSDSVPTLMGTAIGTPAFMSPEQAAGRLRDLGPASDVYGLGATLFYVLTGKPPVASEESGETLRKVQAGDIARPRDIRPETPPPLEAICLKSLSREPAQRYPTAGALAMDVERWLADEAVTALTDTPLGRLARWGRHHRTLVATAIVGLLGASLALAAIAVQQSASNRALRRSQAAVERQQKETAQQRDLAQRNLDRAVQAINDSLIIIGEEELLDTPGLQPLRRRLLDEGLVYYLELMKDYQQEADLREEAVETYLRLGEVLRQIGTAEETLDYYTQSLTVIEDLTREQPDNPRLLATLAANLNGMGLTLAEIGRAEEASQAYERALEIYEPLVAASPSPNLLQSQAMTLSNSGILAFNRGQPDKGIRRYRASRQIRHSLVEDHPEVEEYQAALAQDLFAWVVVYTMAGSIDQATEAVEECRQLYAKLCENHPRVTDYAVRRGMNLTNYGSLLLRQGKVDEAQPIVQQAVEILGRLAEQNPAVAPYRNSAAGSLNMLSDLYRYADRRQEGLAAAERAREMLLELTAEHPDVDDYLFHLAKAHSNIGRLTLAQDRVADALKSFMDAAAALERITLPPVNGNYNLACYLALCVPLINGENSDSPDDLREATIQRALAALEKAIDGGYRDVNHMRNDSDLKSLRELAAFEALMRKASQPNDPEP
jgi:serine/threonine-protein kinase